MATPELNYPARYPARPRSATAVRAPAETRSHVQITGTAASVTDRPGGRPVKVIRK